MHRTTFNRGFLAGVLMMLGGQAGNSSPGRSLKPAVALLVLLLAGRLSAQTPAADSSTLPGEAIFPITSRELWEHARNLLREHVRFDTDDGKNQLLITKALEYDRLMAVRAIDGGRVPGPDARHCRPQVFVAVICKSNDAVF